MDQGRVRKPRRGLKGEQIRGVPSYPVVTLHPISLTDGLRWELSPGTQLSVGIMVRVDGDISYSPVMVPRMRGVDKVLVRVHVDAFEPECRYSLRLRYFDNEERQRELRTDVLDPSVVDRFDFLIPTDQVDFEAWFTCALRVELHAPMTGGRRQAHVQVGQENPYEPVLVRGCWLEIRE